MKNDWLQDVPASRRDPGKIITEKLAEGELTAADLLEICALPKFRKCHFNLLLDARVDLHVTDEHGANALFAAASSGNLVLLRSLLDQGLDPMHRDDSGEIPLSVAVRCGNLSVAECLLDITENHAAVVDADGSTLLHKAAWGDMPSVARELIDEYGIPLEARDRAGHTAVHVAAYQGSGRMLKYLLTEKSADVNAADNEGRTPLFSAAYDGNLRHLKFLCGHGADLSVKDKYGMTAAVFARGKGESRAAGFLNRQADPLPGAAR